MQQKKELKQLMLVLKVELKVRRAYRVVSLPWMVMEHHWRRQGSSSYIRTVVKMRVRLRVELRSSSSNQKRRGLSSRRMRRRKGEVTLKHKQSSKRERESSKGVRRGHYRERKRRKMHLRMRRGEGREAKEEARRNWHSNKRDKTRKVPRTALTIKLQTHSHPRHNKQ
jgi:hypothetical protein